MPTRLIREGILTSDRVDNLDYPGEVFYRRLMSKVDDHGLHDARPSVLRAALYPLRIDRVREADISRWLAECQTAGLLALYDAGGKTYLKMLDTRWKARSEPKCPVPTPEQLKCAKAVDKSTCKQVKTTENNCFPSRSRISKSESLLKDDAKKLALRAFMANATQAIKKKCGSTKRLRKVFGICVAYLAEFPGEQVVLNQEIDYLPASMPELWYEQAIRGIISRFRGEKDKQESQPEFHRGGEPQGIGEIVAGLK